MDHLYIAYSNIFPLSWVKQQSMIFVNLYMISISIPMCFTTSYYRIQDFFVLLLKIIEYKHVIFLVIETLQKRGHTSIKQVFLQLWFLIFP